MPFHITLSDSGANLTAGPTKLITFFKDNHILLQEPITVIFGDKNIALSRSYLDFPGTLLNRIYLLDCLPHCIFSTSDLNRRGFNVECTNRLTCEITNGSHTILLTTPLNEPNQLYYFNLSELLLPIQPISQGQPQISAVQLAEQPRLTKQQIADVIDLHERLNHPGSAVMARAIAAHAWTGISDSITAALIDRVFRNQACLSCHLGQTLHIPHGVGTGAPYPYLGYAISVDYVPVSVVALGGWTGFFCFRELTIGAVFFILCKQKLELLRALNRVRRYLLSCKCLPLRVLKVDAGTVENAAATITALESEGVHVDSAAPEQQCQNPAERTIRTVNHTVATMLIDQHFLGRDSWAKAVIFMGTTSNALPNTLSGEYSPEYHLTGVHPDISRFRFKFGQPVICPRLIATRQRDGFRFSPYGQLGFYVGSAGLHGDSLIHFPENKRAVDHIRSEVQAIQLYRQDIKTNALAGSTVSYDNQGQLLFPNPVHMHTILPQLIVNSTPADLLLFDSAENIQTEISCTDRSSNIPDELAALVSAVRITVPIITEKIPAVSIPITTDSMCPVQCEEKSIPDMVGIPITETPQENTTLQDTDFRIGDTVVYTDEKFIKNICVIFKITSSRYKTYYYIRPITDQPNSKGFIVTGNIAKYTPSIPQVNLVLESSSVSSSSIPPAPNLRSPTSAMTRYLNTLMAPEFQSPILDPIDDNPKFRAARAGPDWERCWKPACEEEMQGLRDFKTGTEIRLEDIPDGAPIYPTKFDLKTKRDLVTGAVQKFKARLCVLGDAFQTGFKALYAPTVKYGTLMLIATLAVYFGMQLTKTDCKKAFLYPDLPSNDHIFIQLPETYMHTITGKTPKRVYWKLNKTLYGLPQSPEAFYRDVSHHLLTHGYLRSSADPCLFYRRGLNGELTLICVHVDDFAIAGSSSQQIDEVVRIMRLRYTISVDLRLESYIGIHVEYERDGSVTLSQPNMIREIFRDYNMTPKTVRVPMSSDFNDKEQDDSPRIDHIQYMRLLGRLMYVVRTRPDIAYAINRLATRANRATERDFQALLRVLLYLDHTKYLGLRFHHSRTDVSTAKRLFCFVDAAFATHTDSRSHSGYCFGMGDLIGMFFSRSFKQTGVTLSSTESENWAAVEAVKEIIWFRTLLEEIGFPQNGPTTIYADNASMIILAEHFSGNHSRIKHFMCRINFLIEKVQEGVIHFEHVPTEMNVADILTKPLGPIDFERLRPLLLGM